jgi:hypothetical protein
MKLSIIENPQSSTQMSKITLSALLNEKEMNEILGGDIGTCGTYNNCGIQGLNSCETFSCKGQVISCSGTKTWVQTPLVSNNQLANSDLVVKSNFAASLAANSLAANSNLSRLSVL